MSELYGITLDKWPGMLVAGRNVPKLMAEEICVRTSSMWLSCNDKVFQRQVNEVLGLPSNEHGYVEDWRAVERVEQEFGNLRLEYLGNGRILSAWTGGPHGWCDWEGNIGCHNYNIGKWPSVEEVHEEWKRIAEAFPALNLICQLLDGEICSSTTPVVEFAVGAGKAFVREPSELIAQPTPETWRALWDVTTERGITIERFREVVARLKRGK